MLLYGEVPIDYSLAVNIVTIFGTILGIYGNKILVRKTGGKNSYSVLLLVIVILTILISTVGITIDQIIEKHSLGIPIFESEGYCS